MHNRVRTSLSTLKSNGLIENVGNDNKPLGKKKQ